LFSKPVKGRCAATRIAPEDAYTWSSTHSCHRRRTRSNSVGISILWAALRESPQCCRRTLISDGNNCHLPSIRRLFASCQNCNLGVRSGRTKPSRPLQRSCNSMISLGTAGNRGNRGDHRLRALNLGVFLLSRSRVLLGTPRWVRATGYANSSVGHAGVRCERDKIPRSRNFAVPRRGDSTNPLLSGRRGVSILVCRSTPRLPERTTRQSQFQPEVRVRQPRAKDVHGQRPFQAPLCNDDQRLWTPSENGVRSNEARARSRRPLG
jgi:hypothetical protein